MTQKPQEKPLEAKNAYIEIPAFHWAASHVLYTATCPHCGESNAILKPPNTSHRLCDHFKGHGRNSISVGVFRFLRECERCDQVPDIQDRDFDLDEPHICGPCRREVDTIQSETEGD